MGYWGYQEYLSPTQTTPTLMSVSNEQETAPQVISAEGKVVPFDHVRLSFNVPGLIEAVFVDEGESVQEGDLIARLRGREQIEATIAAAQLELISAEQALDELLNLAPLTTAHAQQELANARDELDEAERRWRSHQADNRASSDTIRRTEEQLILAEEAVDKAQEAYDRLSDRPQGDIARMITYSALLAAKQQRDMLKGQLSWYEGQPTDIDQALLDADVSMAEARLAEAERQWEILKNGADPDEVALAEARLESAKTQLAAAQASLDDLELRAPFDSSVITVDLKVGESVSPGVPLILLADLSRWQVETTDLTENDISLVTTGMEATIILNAFPDQEFHGTVRKIALLGEERRGSVTYSVTLDLDPEDANIQWEMTAFVDIFLP
jgi:multidrug resistance efflux pump